MMSKALPPSPGYRVPCLLETLLLKLGTEWLLSSEQGDVSQARGLPAEVTVDSVAAALQDLRQHLKQTQQDLVTCI